MRIGCITVGKNIKEWHKQLISHVQRIADFWVYIDNGSEPEQYQAVKEFADSVGLDYYSEVVEGEWDCGALREKAFLKAVEKGADWVLLLDGDEVLEEKAENMLRLICNTLPKEINCVDFFVSNFWKSNRYYRVDGVFGDQKASRLLRVVPGKRLMHDKSPHVPYEYEGEGLSTKYLSVFRLKHYSFVNKDVPLKKYIYYSKVDDANYGYLLSESTLGLQIFNPEYNPLYNGFLVFPYAESCVQIPVEARGVYEINNTIEKYKKQQEENIQ